MTGYSERRWSDRYLRSPSPRSAHGMTHSIASPQPKSLSHRGLSRIASTGTAVGRRAPGDNDQCRCLMCGHLHGINAEDHRRSPRGARQQRKARLRDALSSWPGIAVKLLRRLRTLVCATPPPSFSSEARRDGRPVAMQHRPVMPVEQFARVKSRLIVPTSAASRPPRQC
jgi:hypothetical protein